MLGELRQLRAAQRFRQHGVVASLAVHNPRYPVIEINPLRQLRQPVERDRTVDKTIRHTVFAQRITDQGDRGVVGLGSDRFAQNKWFITGHCTFKIIATGYVDRLILGHPADPIAHADGEGAPLIAIALPDVGVERFDKRPDAVKIHRLHRRAERDDFQFTDALGQPVAGFAGFGVEQLDAGGGDQLLIGVGNGQVYKAHQNRKGGGDQRAECHDHSGFKFHGDHLRLIKYKFSKICANTNKSCRAIMLM